MKKALLLSVVASTMIMAGGDIEPVAAPVEVPAWEFGGQAVVYYQTMDEVSRLGTEPGLFDQTGATANVGLQLRAVNKDVLWGIGAGAEVSGVGTWGLENDVVSGVMQGAGDEVAARGGWISQAYLTAGFGNTSIKAGRQELPKSLSPFAFSEGWNVFKNTFDAALIVNTDITDTTLVGAWVEGANHNNIFGAPTGNLPMILTATTDNKPGFTGVVTGGNMADYSKVNGGAGIYMLTAQNKSVEALTLTGSYYYAPSYLTNITAGLVDSDNDAHILWGDAKYAGFEGFRLAGQVGSVMSDDFADDTLAYGALIGGQFDLFDVSLAYSGVDDGGVGVFNVGGVKTPLYTQIVLNQDAIRVDSDTFVARAGVKVLGGRFGVAYNYSDLGELAVNGTAIAPRKVTDSTGETLNVLGGAGTYNELDVTYKVKVWNDSTTLFAGYIYQSDERDATSVIDPVDGSVIDVAASEKTQNTIRVWGRYNF